jgi:hypothetical protein
VLSNTQWFWVAIAASAIISVSRWLLRTERQQAAAGWPSIQANIDSVDVSSHRRDTHYAKVEYSYGVDGQTYSGTYKRTFSFEKEAWSFISKVQLLPTVPVRYKPQNPATSCVRDEDMDQVVQTFGNVTG